jgi:hypothetical protein
MRENVLIGLADIGILAGLWLVIIGPVALIGWLRDRLNEWRAGRRQTTVYVQLKPEPTPTLTPPTYNETRRELDRLAAYYQRKIRQELR